MLRFLLACALAGLCLAAPASAASAASTRGPGVSPTDDSRQATWEAIVHGKGLGRPVGETGGMPDPIG